MSTLQRTKTTVHWKAEASPSSSSRKRKTASNSVWVFSVTFLGDESPVFETDKVICKVFSTKAKAEAAKLKFLRDKFCEIADMDNEEVQELFETNANEHSQAVLKDSVSSDTLEDLVVEHHTDWESDLAQIEILVHERPVDDEESDDKEEGEVSDEDDEPEFKGSRVKRRRIDETPQGSEGEDEE
jgi:hypothetical protein